jgi:hypothetical protein
VWFWTWIKISLAWLALAGWLAAEEQPAPWLLHPLKNRSSLSLVWLRWQVDYRVPARPGWVWLSAQALLRNPSSQPAQEQFLLVSDDPDAQMRWQGRSLSSDKLVLPLPGSVGQMARVSVFELILLGQEEGRWFFDGQLRLDFLDTWTHQVRLRNCQRRAWRSQGDSELIVRLPDQFRLLGSGFRSGRRSLTAYHDDRLAFQVAAPVGPRPSWGVLGAVPGLYWAWSWALLCALIGVTGLVFRRFRWVGLPLAAGVYPFGWSEISLNFYQNSRELERLRGNFFPAMLLVVATALAVGSLLTRRWSPKDGRND